jgi:hypothetical protein
MNIVKKKELKSVKVKSVIVELTPQEVGTLTAALAATSYDERKRWGRVPENMLLSASKSTELYNAMRKLLEECEDYEEETL